jgi:hypothetical protein
MLELDYEENPLEAISKSLHLEQYDTTEKPSALLKNAFNQRIKTLEKLLQNGSLSERTRQEYLTEISILKD